MARKKSTPASSSRKFISFKIRNKLGRDGRRKAKLIKLPTSNFWASLRVALRRRVHSRELYLRICNYIKTSSNLLINTPKQDLLVEAGSYDTNRITNLIHRYLPKIQINNVKKVCNPYLTAMYSLKKKEYMSRYKSKHSGSTDPLQERELFHSTKQIVVNDIVINNLNWRCVGRARFGRGNCFSSDPDYANCHANRSNGENRAFIVCNVLVRDKKLGSPSLEVLPDSYDTATGGRTNEIIYVKFDDNEFLPQFVVYYKCNMERDVYGSKYNRMPSSWF